MKRRAQIVRRSIVAVIVLVATFASSSAWALGDITAGATQLDAITKTQVQIYSPFDEVPDRGFLPIKIKIRNGHRKNLTWNLSCKAENDQLSFSSSFSIVTTATSETEHEVMVPLPTAFDNSINSVSLTLTSVAGIVGGELEGRIRGGWISAGMSRGVLARDNDRVLTDQLQAKHKLPPHVDALSLFDAPELIADWRAFTGFDALMFTDTEWFALTPTMRREVLAWNRLGGFLHLFTETQNANLATFGIEGTGPKTNINGTRRSLGRVFIHNWDGDRIPVARVATALRDLTPATNQELQKSFSNKWALQEAFGFEAFNPVAVFIILIAFAIAVGPVNLFVLAKPGMRHRLFYTTPIISLIASVLLIGLILFKDGFGGSGQRVAVMLLHSDKGERRAYVVQEQISRTGVLLSKAFTQQDPAFLTPVVMNQSSWTFFDNGIGNISGSYAYHHKKHAGDWFHSRSEQAHFAQTVRPTRARIERLPAENGGNPRFFASVDFGLEHFYYVDDDKNVWKTTSRIAAGQEIETEPATETDLKAFWNNGGSANAVGTGDNVHLFSPSLGARINSLVNQRDTYFASVSPNNHEMIPTLSSIRWGNRDRLLLVGSPVDPQTESGGQ